MDASHADIVIKHFSDFFCSKRDDITQQWLTAVQNDPRLQTADKLSLSQLKDHLPSLYDNLVRAVCDPTNHESTRNLNKDAREHGKQRFGQGYHLKELIRELSRVRSVIIYHMVNFQEQEPDITTETKALLFIRMEAFFNEIISDSVDQFVKEQVSELETDAEGARQESISTKSLNQKLQNVDSARLSLLRNVVHELGNSFYGIQLSIKSFQEDTLKEDRLTLFETLDRQITETSELLSDLLHFSIILDEDSLPVKLEPVSPQSICDKLLAVYTPRAQAKGLELHSECEHGLDTIFIDRIKILQITGNLLANAVKYTEKGSVKFWLRGVDDRSWSFGVKDTGPGISENERQDIFKEFHRSERTSHCEGTGLGLSIVQRLTNLFGGKIIIETKLNEGSTFEVILPRNPELPK